MDDKEIFIQDLIKRCYFRPKLYKINQDGTNKYRISKQFLINILFPNISIKKQQKNIKKSQRSKHMEHSK